MLKQICLTALAALMALAFIVGVAPDSPAVCASAEGDVVPDSKRAAGVGFGCDITEGPSAPSPAAGTAVVTEAYSPVTGEAAEVYYLPDGARPTDVHINGRTMSDGFGAEYGGVVYIALDAFLREIGGASPGAVPDFVAAVPGEPYITSRGRCIPCSDTDLSVTVLEWEGCIRVPVCAAASAAGMKLTVGGITDGVDRTGGVTGDSADGAVVLSGVPLFPSADDVYDPDDVYWLSRIISAEARGEPFEGQLAVGSVVINRTRSTKYPDSIFDVIFDTRFGIQFSPAASGSVYREPTESATAAAKLCLEGFSTSDSILFFFNSSIAVGGWITSNRTYTMTVGQHDFYS